MTKTKKTTISNPSTPIKLEDQPLSSYPWIAFQQGFNSLEEVARHFKVDEKDLKKRVKERKGKRKKVITGIIMEMRRVNGLTYKGKPVTVKELAEISGLSYATVQKRARRGWTGEEIVNTPKQDKIDKVYFVDGERFETIAELAKAYGKAYSTISSRLRNGMTAAEAVHTPSAREKHKSNSKVVFCMGQKFESLQKLCDYYELNYQTVNHHRLEHPEECLDYIVMRLLHKPMYQYIVYGRGFSTLVEIAEYYEISYEYLIRSVRKGNFSTIEEIIEKAQVNKKKMEEKRKEIEKQIEAKCKYKADRKIANNIKKNTFRYVVHGKKFNVITKLAEEFKVDYKELYKMIKKQNIDAEIAVDMLLGTIR